MVDTTRAAILKERIREVFKAAHAAGVPRYSIINPWHEMAAVDGSDPFATAVWSMDQVLRKDPLPEPWPTMMLNYAEWYCGAAEREIIAHRRHEQLMNSAGYICSLSASAASMKDFSGSAPAYGKTARWSASGRSTACLLNA